MKIPRNLFAQFGAMLIILKNQISLYKSSVFLFLLLLTVAGCALPFNRNLTPEEQVAVVTTDKGIFVFEFYPDAAPVAVDNFIKLIDMKVLRWIDIS